MISNYFLLPVFFLTLFGISCSTTPRLKPSKNFTDEQRYLFYRDHALSLNEKEPLVHSNFLFFSTSILQGGKSAGNARDVFEYYPETAKKYKEEWNKWDKSWNWGIGGLTYGTLGILGFTGVIGFAPFWNYLFSSIGAIAVSVSAYTFIMTTPDYESLIPAYNELLRKELDMAPGLGYTKMSIMFRFN